LEKGELCRIEDNQSNQFKWRIVSLRQNRDAYVPSICFILKGPDPHAIEQLDKLKFKYNQLLLNVNHFENFLKKENISRIMKTFIDNSKKSSQIFDDSTQADELLRTVKCEVECIIKNNSDENGYSVVPNGNTFSIDSSTSSIVNSDDFSSLINDFKKFNQILEESKGILIIYYNHEFQNILLICCV
jgi:hypothetical protein